MYEFRLDVQDTSAFTIKIYRDVSRMDRVKDLRKRGAKTVLVKKSGVEVDAEVDKNYDKVELMDPMVEKCCAVYTEDLDRRVGFNDRYMSPLLTTHVLLNPMFGLEKRVVRSGLLTREQYDRGGMSEYCIHGALVSPKSFLLFYIHK